MSHGGIKIQPQVHLAHMLQWPPHHQHPLISSDMYSPEEFFIGSQKKYIFNKSEHFCA